MALGFGLTLPGLAWLGSTCSDVQEPDDPRVAVPVLPASVIHHSRMPGQGALNHVLHLEASIKSSWLLGLGSACDEPS